MAMLKTILTPTDFSDLWLMGFATRANWPGTLALTLIVFNSAICCMKSNAVNKRDTDQCKKQLEEFCTQKVAHAGDGLKVRQMVDAGQPFASIVHCAEKEGVHLIVMSSHGRSGLSRHADRQRHG